MLYIPHGSDNTCFEFVIRVWLRFLYIPHGSDNTDRPIHILADAPPFISHMVQIIHKFAEQFLLKDNTLYPTWFR